MNKRVKRLQTFGDNQCDDQRLFERIQLRDAKAFNTVYERYWSILFNEAYKRINDMELCEEIVQDVFASLWETSPQRNIQDLGAYLFSCMRFQVFAHYHKRTREQEATHADLFDSKEFLNDGADEYMLEKDLVSFIKNWLGSLPKKRREIFHLRYLEGLSVKEISELMGVSPNTVQNHLGLSLAKIRFLLKKYFLVLFLVLFR
ncbi:RNA polymerase sigma factor [Olivibacter sp. XZL3]|uniref:RNA polymerase sigma factor n=1 Tax=Olivibacter sp. XZL3 TaxID=1735116 RepID=UPI0010658296|nr:sigma-70 family RNA polymerase sigma factor [Olivibacter sp. XZL3]